MSDNSEEISERKREHLELCLTDEVAFKQKKNGFDYYDFIHNAATEVELNKISFQTKFFGKKISYPFLISCMTGGADEAENINAKLAVAAAKLNVPIGVGSQRQIFENKTFKNSYKVIRKNAAGVPVLGNIGAAQVAAVKSVKRFQQLVNVIEADALVIHLNAAQELLQKNGEPNFKGLLDNITRLTKTLTVPVIVKEVGTGVSSAAAKKLLDAGVAGIDVAGAGGTSWTGVEILRNKNTDGIEFWDWGLPASYCIKEIFKLKRNYKFTLIGSGGINSAMDAAKALALGSDLVASARIILTELHKNDIEGVINLISGWFDTIKKIMFLTGSKNLKQLRKNKLIKKDLLF
jgi:isopentenyl-diphosphate delta-isomerase